MTDIAGHFINESRKYLSEVYLKKLTRCLDMLTDEDVWWRAGEESNSIGNLLLHLDGSTRMWIVSGVGGAPNKRERQQEFDERALIPRVALIAKLTATLKEVDAVLASVDESELMRLREIRGHDYTALEAIFHAVEHFAMHAGQIMLLTKMRAGRDLKLSN